MGKPTISVDEPSVSEVDCVVCSQWPPADRETMRIMINRIPLDGICPECEMAFWRRLWPAPGPPTRH